MASITSTVKSLCRRNLLNSFIHYLTLIVILLSISEATEILRPRGVSVAKAALYSPSNDFACFDGSAVVSFLRVNDDYCDCKDGSDEPGTAACPNGSFHCTNAGHKSINIPSSRVNDGVCDCCDASDEYESSANCINNCGELGAAAWAEAMKLAEVSRKGNELRLSLSQQGKQMRQERQERMQQLEKEREEVERVKREKEYLKTVAEEAERGVLDKYKRAEEAERERQRQAEEQDEEREMFDKFQLLDSNHDGKIIMGEIQARQTFDQDRNGAVSDDEAKYFLSSTGEMDWEEFRESGYSRMKPYFLLESGMFKPPEDAQKGDNAEQKPQAAETATQNEEGAAEAEEEEVAGSNGKGGSEEGEELFDEGSVEVDKEEEVPVEEEEEDEEEEEEGEEEVTNQEEAVEKEDTPPPKYDEETQRLIDEANNARAEAEEADRAVRDLSREARQIQDSLERDYGEDEEFAVLDGQCFEYTDREYTYRLCPFDQATQRPKNGGSETRLGTWSGWLADGSTRAGKYSRMLYDKGQGCWNGPQRSTMVQLVCGMEHAVTAVSEPNRCEYMFEFVTPCICREVDDKNMAEHIAAHDEL